MRETRMACQDALRKDFGWLWDGLPEDVSKALQDSLVQTRVPKGEVLFDFGAENESLWLIGAGELDIEMETPRGRLRMGHVEAGGLIGETDLVSPRATPVCATATRDALLCRLDRPAYQGLRETAPRAVGRLVSAICCDVARRIRRASVGFQPAATGRGFDYQPALHALHGVERTFTRMRWIPAGAGGSTTNERILVDLYRTGVFDRVRENDPELASGLEADLEMLAPGLGYQEHGGGETIIARGASADGVYILLDGEVRVTVGKPDDWFHVDRRLGPGETFGEIAFFDDGTRSATVVTTRPARLAVVYPATVKELLLYAEVGNRVPLDMLEWFARQLVSDARHLDERIRERMSQASGMGETA